MGHPTDPNIFDEHGTEILSYLVALFFIDNLIYWVFVFNYLQIKLILYLLFYIYFYFKGSLQLLTQSILRTFPFSMKFLVPNNHTDYWTEDLSITKFQLCQTIFSWSFFQKMFCLNVEGKEVLQQWGNTKFGGGEKVVTN